VVRLTELDPRYVDVIVRRWQDWTGQQAVREADGHPFRALNPCGDSLCEPVEDGPSRGNPECENHDQAADAAGPLCVR